MYIETPFIYQTITQPNIFLNPIFNPISDFKCSWSIPYNKKLIYKIESMLKHKILKTPLEGINMEYGLKINKDIEQKSVKNLHNPIYTKEILAK